MKLKPSASSDESMLSTTWHAFLPQAEHTKKNASYQHITIQQASVERLLQMHSLLFITGIPINQVHLLRPLNLCLLQKSSRGENLSSSSQRHEAALVSLQPLGKHSPRVCGRHRHPSVWLPTLTPSTGHFLTDQPAKSTTARRRPSDSTSSQSGRESCTPLSWKQRSSLSLIPDNRPSPSNSSDYSASSDAYAAEPLPWQPLCMEVLSECDCRMLDPSAPTRKREFCLSNGAKLWRVPQLWWLILLSCSVSIKIPTRHCFLSEEAVFLSHSQTFRMENFAGMVDPIELLVYYKFNHAFEFSNHCQNVLQRPGKHGRRSNVFPFISLIAVYKYVFLLLRKMVLEWDRQLSMNQLPGIWREHSRDYFCHFLPCWEMRHLQRGNVWFFFSKWGK